MNTHFVPDPTIPSTAESFDRKVFTLLHLLVSKLLFFTPFHDGNRFASMNNIRMNRVSSKISD